MAECEKCIQDHGLEKSRNVVAIKTTCEQMMLVAKEQIKNVCLLQKTRLKI